MAASSEHVFALICGNFLENDAFCSTLKSQLRIISDLELISGCKTSGLQTLTRQVNAALSSSKNRLEGLCLLKCLLSQCSTELFQEHAVTWLRLLVQTLQSYDPAFSLQLSCDVTADLLQHMSCFAEMSRDVSSSLIPQLITTLLTAKQQWQSSAVTCLSSCLRYFPGPCGPFKMKIENLLIAVLGGNNNSAIQAASECYALLARAGGGGSMGIKHTEAWSVSCNKLVGSLQVVLNQLYSDIELDDGDHQVSDGSVLDLPPVSETEPARTLELNSRFEILTECLHKLLSTEFPATVRVPLENMLSLVCRTLAVSPKQLAVRGTQEMLLLMSVLPQLQQQAYRLLSSLITSCGSCMCVHGSVINKLFLQTLNWSSLSEEQQVYGQDRPYRELRCEIYECIQQWVTVTGPSSGVEHIASDLWPHLLGDAKPQQDTMKIETKSHKVSEGPNVGSQKKKKGGSAHLGHSTSHRKLKLTANSNICLQALRALRSIILRVGSFLKPKLHKMTHEVLIPTLLRIQQSRVGVIPYTLASCRQALYQLLQATVLVPHPQWPAPTQCAIALFRKGQQDSDLQVAATCSEALIICDGIIRPKAPTLHSPLPIPAAVSPASKENGHQIDVGTPTISFRSPSKLTMPASDQLTLRSGTTITGGMFSGAVAADAMKESIQETTNQRETDEVEEMEISKDNGEEADENNDSDNEEEDPDWVTDEEEEVENGDEGDGGGDEEGDGEGVEDAEKVEMDDGESNPGEKKDGNDDGDDAWVTDEEEEVIGGTPSSERKKSSPTCDEASDNPSSSLAESTLPEIASASASTDQDGDTLKRKLDFVGADAREDDSPASKKVATTDETDETEFMLSAFVDAPPDSD